MIDRFWDKNNKYPDGFLKDYNHWALEMSYRQHTLGCYIIFAKRPGVKKISELTSEELTELRRVMWEMETALLNIKIFKPDHFNYWQMGNALSQLHWHGIPRYSSTRTFAEQEWCDLTWGTVPQWTKEDSSHDLVKTLKKVIIPHLP